MLESKMEDHESGDNDGMSRFGRGVNMETARQAICRTVSEWKLWGKWGHAWGLDNITWAHFEGKGGHRDLADPTWALLHIFARWDDAEEG